MTTGTETKLKSFLHTETWHCNVFTALVERKSYWMEGEKKKKKKKQITKKRDFGHLSGTVSLCYPHAFVKLNFN